MSEYVANLVASLRAGARLGPNEAARAVLPLAEALAAEHEHGMVRGSLDPAYVPPEVELGLRPTAASDVWSLGALLFHAMAGHAPFEHSTQTPARLRRAGWLGPIVERALSASPEDRPSMAEMAAYLRSRETPAATDDPEPTIPLAAPPPPPVEAVEPTAPVGPVEPVEPPAIEPAAVAPVRPIATATHAAPRPARRPALLALVLAAVVVVLALIAGALALGRHHGGPTVATPPAGTQPSAISPTHASTSTQAKRKKKPAQPTAAQLTAFARRYVATASSDPSAGFRMLTAAYQRSSPRYQDFWSSVHGARITGIHANPRAMTVTYTYRYTLTSGPQRGRRTETVTLDLVRQHGRILIAGAS